MKAKGTQYISSIMYWLDYEHMRLHKEYMIWDGWSVYNPYTKCTQQNNGHYCGAFAIKFIDFDSLDASLMFSNNMVRYRDILQYSMTSLS